MWHLHNRGKLHHNLPTIKFSGK